MTEVQAQPTGMLRPRARLVHTLGSDLISSERVALIELVKNSYDADASHVILKFIGPLEAGQGSIQVWDNGHGMSLETVTNVWSEIATPFRRTSLKSERGNRRVLGEKGIGRLAASRIASSTKIVTQRSNAQEVTVELDWDQFTQDIYLDEVRFEISERPAHLFTPDGLATTVMGEAQRGHGTLVHMVDLKRTWDESEIRQLRLALSRLAEPLPAGALETEIENDFIIRLQLPDELSHLAGDIAPSDTLSHPHYSIRGTVEANGEMRLIYEEWLTGITSEITKKATVLTNDGRSQREPTCGFLKVDIRAWDLDKTAFDATRGKINIGSSDIKDYRTEIKEHSGVGLFRDRFRVQPFGEPTYDWLNLDARRVNNPTTRLSNNQVSGFIFISADSNPGLRDRSHREGLIDTQEYEDLQSVALQAIEELEARRRRSRKSRQETKQKEQSPSGLFGNFSLNSLHELSRSRSHDRELQQAVKEVEASVQTGIKQVKETLARFSRLATLGSVVDIVLHEGRGALGRIKSGAMQLSKASSSWSGTSADSVKAANKYTHRVLSGADTLSTLFKRIEPLSGRRRGRPSRVELLAIVDAACDVLEPEFERLNIEVTKRVSAASVTVDESEILQVLINLLDNASYWLTHVEPSKRRVLVEGGRLDDGSIILRVSDSGPGVPEEIRDEIFDAYYSRKPDGTGLGLAIAGSTVQDFYDGSLELVASDELPGASFQVTLRRRLGE